MTFSDVLNQYISDLHCTAKELSEQSGVSAATISRYRSGDREPHVNGSEIDKLVHGIVSLSQEKIEKPLLFETVYQALTSSLSKGFESETTINNFNTLISVLDINLSKLARFMNYDNSYLYRIRTGQRRPADIHAFTNSICQFIITEYTSDAQKSIISELMGCQVESLHSKQEFFTLLEQWITNGNYHSTNYMSSFLEKLDAFDLDEYIRVIHFDELKTFSVPFQLPSSKHFYGIEQMKEGELTFFKQTVLSKSTEPIFMYSDMPMADMGEDLDFGKKWMFAIAMSLKKGLHLNIIHNVDRPFQEMMLGLESWIPIYMTGQVSPFHLKNISNNYYHQLTYVSGCAALDGQCIDGYHKNGKYYFTNNKTELSYYQQRAHDLLSKASPLMDIYRKPETNIYHAFLTSNAKEKGARRNILSSLPLHTISDDLLEQILSHNDLMESEKTTIRDWVQRQRNTVQDILKHSPITDECCVYTRDEFQQFPVVLSIAGSFLEKEVFYSYEEYLEHISLTEAFADEHSNYEISTEHYHAFRNIQIQIMEDSLVVISKNKAPVIHFVIQHPKLVHALENFVPVFE